MAEAQLEITDLYKKDTNQDMIYDNLLFSYINQQKYEPKHDQKNYDNVQNNFIEHIENDTLIVTNNADVTTYKNIFINKENITLDLQNGINYEIKNFYLVYPNSFASLKTQNGTCIIDNTNMIRTLIYDPKINNWKIVNSKNNNFYPSRTSKIIEGKQNTGYGSSIFMNDKYIYVGNYLSNNCIGNVEIYDKDTMHLEQALCGSESIGCSFQGIAISSNYDGSTLVIGGSGDDNGNGACWIFTYNGNSYIEKIKLKHILHFGLNCALHKFKNIMLVSGIGYVKIFENYEERETFYGDNNFGQYLFIGNDKFIIGSTQELLIGNIENFMICEKIKINNILPELICSDYDCKNILVVDKNNFMYIKTDQKYILDDLQNEVGKILNCTCCDNGETIVICCEKDNKYELLCYILVNNKFIKCNHFPITKTQLSLSKLFLNGDGRNIIFSCCSDDDYNGFCLTI